MEIVDEWYPTGTFRKFDKIFRTDSKYEKERMNTLPLTCNSLHKTEMENHRKFGHTLGKIQHIALMSRIVIFYTDCRLSTQTVSPTITGFQGIKSCVQYIAINLNKPIFYPYSSYDV